MRGSTNGPCRDDHTRRSSSAENSSSVSNSRISARSYRPDRRLDQEPKKFWFAFHHDGVWTQDPKEMLQHHSFIHNVCRDLPNDT